MKRKIIVLVLLVILTPLLLYFWYVQAFKHMLKDKEPLPLVFPIFSVEKLMSEMGLDDYYQPSEFLNDTVSEKCSSAPPDFFMTTIRFPIPDTFLDSVHIHPSDRTPKVLPTRVISQRSHSLLTLLACHYKSHPEIIFPSLRLLILENLALFKQACTISDFATALRISERICKFLQEHKIVANLSPTQIEELEELLKLLLNDIPSYAEILRIEADSFVPVINIMEQRHRFMSLIYWIGYGDVSDTFRDFMYGEDHSIEKIFSLSFMAQAFIVNLPTIKSRREETILALDTVLQSM